MTTLSVLAEGSIIELDPKRDSLDLHREPNGDRRCFTSGIVKRLNAGERVTVISIQPTTGPYRIHDWVKVETTSEPRVVGWIRRRSSIDTQPGFRARRVHAIVHVIERIEERES